MYINNNYSGLFSSNRNQSSFMGLSGLYGVVGEYNNIRSGTYFKVLKEYYGKVSSDNTSVNASKIEKLWEESAKEKSTSSSTTSAYTQVKSSAEDLKKAVNQLVETGKDSLFVEKEKTVKDDAGKETKVKELDTKAIYSAVRNYVSSYNSTLAAAEESGNEAIIRNTGYLTNQTNVFAKPLSEIGITIKDDKTLSLDGDKLESASIEDIKMLFNGDSSYANTASKNVELIANTAKNQATSSYFYNNAGNYQNYGMMSSYMNWYL